MPEISVVKNLPDVSFIDGATVEDIRGEMVADYEAFMSQATGRPLTLDRASPHRVIRGGGANLPRPAVH